MNRVADPRHPVFDHLDRLTDATGLFEHALHATPRAEHGYCVDDAARGLVVVYREPRPGPLLAQLGRCYLDLVLGALAPDGTCRNRMDTDGVWTDEPALGDWWGRASWGLGVAAAHAPSEGVRARALLGFRTAAQQRSPFSRAMTFAALGAGEVLRVAPGEQAARNLLRDAAGGMGPYRPDGTDTDGTDTGGTDTGVEDPAWPWPEPRLRYGNGAVAEALLVAGELLPDPRQTARGLQLLTFLLGVETRDGHLSVTPVGGRGPGDDGPGYDQQPIEVAAIADACATAHRVTGDPRWVDGIDLAWGWFLGANDSGTPMVNERTGGGYDGLEAGGRNLNQGAESTLAALSTAQHARRLVRP